MFSSSYHTDSSVCHVARGNAQGVSEVCMSLEPIINVPNGFGGTRPTRIVTIYYQDGHSEKTVNPEIVEHVENI